VGGKSQQWCASKGGLAERGASTYLKKESTPPARAKSTFTADASNPIVFDKTANWVWESPQGLAKPIDCLASTQPFPTHHWFSSPLP
jgi:hypothetical protein